MGIPTFPVEGLEILLRNDKKKNKTWLVIVGPVLLQTILPKVRRLNPDMPGTCH